MIPMPGKVGRPVGVRYISYEAENGERVANKRVYSPTAGFTALRHLRPAHRIETSDPQPTEERLLFYFPCCLGRSV